jgi:sigma-B regulation protein RsbU (phosphoserine phosphatase)
VRAAAQASRSPAKALARLNEAMLQADDTGWNSFATVACATVRPVAEAAVFTVACAGHPLPILRRAGGHRRALGAPGTLLGCARRRRHRRRPGAARTGRRGRADHGRRDRGPRPCGTRARRGIADVVAEATGSADDLATALMSATLAHLAGGPRDDIAVVVVRVPWVPDGSAG